MCLKLLEVGCFRCFVSVVCYDFGACFGLLACFRRFELLCAELLLRCLGSRWVEVPGAFVSREDD